MDLDPAHAELVPVRPSNQDLVDRLRYRKFPVGSDGCVMLVDVMGDDFSAIQAARVCYGAGTRSVSDDRTLLRYLMRHHHATPFEMAEIKLLVRCPMDAWRQWIRHRTANVNEYSTRYSEAIDSAAVLSADEWRAQAVVNKQGSAGFVTDWPIGMMLLGKARGEDGELKQVHARVVDKGNIVQRVVRKQEKAQEISPATETLQIVSGTYFLENVGEPGPLDFHLDAVVDTYGMEEGHINSLAIPWTTATTPGEYLSLLEGRELKYARQAYEQRLRFNVAREVARKNLPLSTYTEAYWKCDIRNLMHFLGLRMDGHAQKEIRDFATLIGNEILAPLFPETWQAFLDYHHNAVTFSALDLTCYNKAIRPFHPNLFETPDQLTAWLQWAAKDGGLSDYIPAEWINAKCRERDEFYAKLQSLGAAA